MSPLVRLFSTQWLYHLSTVLYVCGMPELTEFIQFNVIQQYFASNFFCVHLSKSKVIISVWRNYFELNNNHHHILRISYITINQWMTLLLCCQMRHNCKRKNQLQGIGLVLKNFKLSNGRIWWGYSSNKKRAIKKAATSELLSSQLIDKRLQIS